MNLQRTPGNVFVNIAPPEPIQQLNNAGAFYRDWTAAAKGIAVDTPPAISELFEITVRAVIEASRWGRYIIPGPDSRVFDNAVFVYHNPCDNWWSLYNLGKALFSDLGIRLSKSDSVWEARIPIEVLTDEVFIESGLASVEKTILMHTGIDPTSDKPSQTEVSKRRTVREITIENGMKIADAGIVAEKAYSERWDVPAKRRVAMRLWEQRVQPHDDTEKDDTGDSRKDSGTPRGVPKTPQLGEPYGMTFVDLATFCESSKHLDADALVAEFGEWLRNCVWALPTEAFWVAWRKAKNALSATGYEVIKISQIWLVFTWRAE